MDIAEENDHLAVDMTVLLASYKSLGKKDDLTIADKPCIFEVPETLKRHHETAYLPKAFSIGPLHYGEPVLEAGQAIKFRFLQDIFRGCWDPRTKLAEVESAVRGKLVEARQCYAKQVEVLGDDEEFVKILVLDGCFIIKLFLTMPDQNESDQFNGHQLLCLNHDLILLENQIPWSVLVLLSNLLFQDHDDLKLREGAILFFKNILLLDGLSRHQELLQTESIEHILDLLRKSLYPSSLEDEKTQRFTYWHVLNMRSPLLKVLRKLLIAAKAQVPELEMALEIQVPSASKLRAAGVKFQTGRLRSGIKFQKGVLEIPFLLIQDSTETMFRNLVAFEQCYRDCPSGYVFTSYARFMDNLIDTVEDIDILHRNGIIFNTLNREDAAKFFNGLYNGTYVRGYLYANVCGQVDRYCQQWWPRWQTFYIHNYFGKPWAIVAQVYALLILALTILQVALAILQVINK